MTHAVEKPQLTPQQVLAPEDPPPAPTPRGTVEKPCFYCSQSCVGLPRVKDRKGRYAHKNCELALHKPKPRKPKARKASQPDFLADLPDLAPSIYDTVAPCPSCNQRVHPRAVLCTNCGTDLTTAPARATETRPLAAPIQPLSVKRTTLWTLGVLTGATLGALAWTVIAPQLNIRTSLPEATISASIGAAIIILAHLSRLLGPR